MKKIIGIAMIILTSFSITAAQTEQAAKTPEIRLAPGSAVTLDGKIGAAEWEGAAVFDLAGGGKVFFKSDGEHLFVGVRGTQKGWSHLYVSDGRDVAVLHASAALGMTVYAPDRKNLWQPSNAFAWELRDRTITAETEKKMAEYLAKNLWAANNVNMTDAPEIEFQVRPRAASNIYAAVVFASDAKKPQYYPATLKDDTIREELVYGATPKDLKFDPKGWAKIVLEKKKTR